MLHAVLTFGIHLFMKSIFGNKSGLKAIYIRRIEKLYNRQIPPQFIITPELALDICKISQQISRQIALLINRKGKIAYVIVGDSQRIVIPDTGKYRAAHGHLRGLRCVHTHLKANEPLSSDDLTDLALLRLDMMVAITLSDNRHTHQVYIGYILSDSISSGKPYHILSPISLDELDTGCLDQIRVFENKLSHVSTSSSVEDGKERALLVSVSLKSKQYAYDSLKELKELAVTCGLNVAGFFMQQRKKVDSRFMMGMGKLQDMVIEAYSKGAEIIIFEQELNTSQIRSITDLTELKVIDRTQLILDIFAQRAMSREGKLQVELAQLQYLLPRLIVKNTALSRLTGGIGGRGPGETKLEINRRRVRDRITRLKKELSLVKKQRILQKAKRNKKGLPIISIIGYTNAGKSTLLNTLTKSNVCAKNQLFATLDPSNRRLKFPKDVEVIITDTVGFIKDLPKALLIAFSATLEELESADLLLHVIDISNPDYENQAKSVEKILRDLDLHNIPVIRIFNKQDLLKDKAIDKISDFFDGIFISACDQSTFKPLIDEILKFIKNMKY